MQLVHGILIFQSNDSGHFSHRKAPTGYSSIPTAPASLPKCDNFGVQHLQLRTYSTYLLADCDDFGVQHI